MTVGVGGFALSTLIPTVKGEKLRIRPPGAVEEKDFLASCIKCGQCVQVCPVEAIFLADVFDGQGLGVPYINARKQACDFSCDGLQCVLACPTGSLSHAINYPHEARMGLAKLQSPDTCLAAMGKGFKGKVREKGYTGKLRFNAVDRWQPVELNSRLFELEICDLCVRLCPIEIRNEQCRSQEYPSGDKNQCPPASAIYLKKVSLTSYIPTIVADGCVGCGVCEMVCPTARPSIVIDTQKIRSKVT